MNDTRFVHVAVNCKNIQTIIDFYGKYFGFEVVRRIPLGPNKEIAFVKNHQGVYLELFNVESELPYPAFVADGPTWQGLRHIAFQVDSLDEKLKELGSAAPITLGPMGFDDFIKGWKTAWVKDPEGNIIEISEGYHD
ncbi:MAG: VOC family protein [Deltaproteobacteria bacterium]|nr:VOC family protein [Deltaproteobacteria bacterium]